MLQRIQTLYLLIVAALLAVLFFPNYATVKIGPVLPVGVHETVGADSTITRLIVAEDGEEEIAFNLWGIYQNGHKAVGTAYMAALVMLALAVAFVTIFLYRKRWLQVRLCFVLAVLLVGIEAFIVLYIYHLNAAGTDSWAIDYSVADVLPIVALVFVYLAYRGIAKDIALVKSLDRIR